MNILLWMLQGLAALLYGASGTMKVVLEMVCAAGLIIPAACRWHPALTVVAAAVLALESVVFIGVHLKHREPRTVLLSGVLGLLLAFIAYGRMFLQADLLRSKRRPLR